VAASFTPEDVRRLADLARLDLSVEEITLFTAQLSGILSFAAEVQAVPTSPLAPADGQDAPPLRDDTPRPSLPREDVLAAAPRADHETGLFTVPRVFEE
jgi:aspartyl-tRNA(Asn)/glutamyl-tRNA(Gln) amidotransferase subunit C